MSETLWPLFEIFRCCTLCGHPRAYPGASRAENSAELKEIQFDFIFDFNLKSISFDNVEVDGKNFPEIDEFINNFNLRTNRKFNKIKFKNFVNNFFNVYAG